jgi:hypothetical protein
MAAYAKKWGKIPTLFYFLDFYYTAGSCQYTLLNVVAQ